MSGCKKNWDRLAWAVILLLSLVISCNMPGWGEEATVTATATVEVFEATTAVDTPTPTETAVEAEPEDVFEAEIIPGDSPETESEVEFDPCAPLESPTGPTVTVDNEEGLRDQAYNAAPGTTILIAAGVYDLQGTIHIVNPGITLRGMTGLRQDVILDGGGMLVGPTQVILIGADDVTIADLTIRNAGEHAVAVQGTDRPSLYNLHILDSGYQLVKVNPEGDGSEDGTLACSRLEYTTTSPEEYTNGISAHNAHRWTVRDNVWLRIRTPGNTPAPTILFWSGSTDTIVERNLLIDCYQGIAFGNSSHEAGDHVGGIVRNNFIYASLPHDSVIEMIHASGWLVAHNTALLQSPNGLDWGMEARFEDTTGTFANNLTNMRIWSDRDGANATMVGNMEGLLSEWLRAPEKGDLHLISGSLPPVDAASVLSEVPADFDGNPRPQGTAPDVGADEFTLNQVYLPLVD